MSDSSYRPLRLDDRRDADEDFLSVGRRKADRLALHFRGHGRHDVIDDRPMVALDEVHVGTEAVRIEEGPGRGRSGDTRESTRRARRSVS